MKKSVLILASLLLGASLSGAEVVRDSLGFKTATANDVRDLLSGYFTDRGVSSLHMESSPVVIIDGVISSIEYLNPSDVESIQILKNASETAAYGVYGANGVLLITTRGGEGRRHINLDSNFGANFGHGLSHNHYLSVSESANNTSFNLSGAFRKAVSSSETSTGSLHANFRSSANKSVKFGLDVLLSYGENTLPTDHDDNAKNYKSLASAFIQLNLTPSLYLKASGGLDAGYGRRDLYYGLETAEGAISSTNENGGAATNIFSKRLGYNTDLRLVFNRYFNTDHHLSAVLSGDITGFKNNTNTMNASNFVVQILRAKSFNAGVYPVSINNFSPEYTHFGAAANLGYDFRSIFGIDATFRIDETYKYYYDGLNLYPSIRAWAKIANCVKLTAGYGESGRELVYPYQIASGMLPGESYTPAEGTLAFHEGLGNLRVKEFHAGASTTLFNGRLSADLTWFSRTGFESFAICQIGAPYSSPSNWSFGGCAKRYDRTSKLSSQGFELAVKGRILNSGNLKWDLSARAIYCDNLILDVDAADFYASELEPGTKYIINSKNLPVGTICGYLKNPDGTLKDVTGEGSITKADMVVLGCSIPKFRYSIESVLSYRDLCFNLLGVKEDGFKLREAALSYRIPLRPSILRGLSVRAVYSEMFYKSLTLGASLEF